MLTTLAHAGHSHDMDTMTTLDHCMPIILASGLIILVLVGVIAYLLTAWQPKTSAKSKKTTKK